MNTTCSFFGHRKIEKTEELKSELKKVILELITEKNVDTFLFGSKSEFDELCHETVSELKEFFPNIKRVYVRAEYPYINNEYKNYLLESYEDTYYPQRIIGAGKAVYVERNCEMVDKSAFCVVFFRGHTKYKSGTEMAVDYALKKGREVIFIGSRETEK